MNSSERLNEHKRKTNTLISGVSELTYYINQIKSDFIDLSDIGKAYERKVYEIYTDIEKKGVDFWSDEFELREAILDHLKTKFYYGAILLKYIDVDILHSNTKLLINKRISGRKAVRILQEQERINVATHDINEYDLNKDLEDTILEYFLVMPDDIDKIKTNRQTYEQMKQNAKQIGLKGITPGIDSFIKEIIRVQEETLQNQKVRKR